MKDVSSISVQGMITASNNQVNCFQTITLTNNVDITFFTTKTKTYLDST
ncbi:hypothetical protein MtrunA17_Chr8g0367711 [Medicago truncatula]|uniref:Uncharacterized protein n=1 Tax=Medicago truncatula TaxID=3880 RepID=A0A396GPT3_MEDTR|nr:hypothetical protein MtrunA17_Chr8g0367711 [Medicago truncatula]